MLKKLTARNFRVYKKKSFAFHKHVTVIIGPNDRGKSTIVNLIRWLCLNRPSGRTVIRRGSKEARGSLQIDGSVLSKILRRSAVYRVGDKHLKAFGTRLPEDVRELANVSEINFQRQHESSFWLALSPGQVAKELNSIVDLESIDAVQSSLAKQIRETSNAIRITEQRYAAARETRRSLAWVRQFDVAISRAERAASRYRAKSRTLAAVASAHQLAVDADATRRHLSVGLPIAHRAAVAGRKMRGAAVQLARLNALYGAAASAQSRLADGPLPDFSAGRQALDRGARLKALRQLQKRIERQTKEVARCQRKLNKTKAKLEKRMGGRCPTCGGILTDQMQLY